MVRDTIEFASEKIAPPSLFARLRTLFFRLGELLENATYM